MELDEQFYSLSLKNDLIMLQLAWGNVNVDASWHLLVHSSESINIYC